MAIYHLHVKNIGRRHGRSVVAAAAYRAGETLPNEIEERESNFGGRRDVLHAEIRLPAGAPAWMGDRAALWNAVEAAEKRKDARLAKEIEVALPRELPFAIWLDLARDLADVYTLRGHAVDLAIHADAAGHNPHCHLMMNTRAIGLTGFGRKLREADAVAFVNEARAIWGQLANAALGKAGAGVEIDPRSLAARGEERAPTRHRGPDQDERRARRAERDAMDRDMVDARRALLAEQDVRQRFPLLASRADWPPLDQHPREEMTQPELHEYRAFWREVGQRVVEGAKREFADVRRDPVPPGAGPDSPLYERDEESRIARRALAMVDSERERAAFRTASIEEAMPTWRELHEAVLERMQEEGYSVGDIKWERIASAMQRFDSQLLEIREREAANAVYRDIMDPGEPDPDGRAIHPRERYAAELAMLEEVAREHYPTPPEPHVPLEAERVAAQTAVERQNAIEVDDRAADFAYRLAPQEDDLDWLREPGARQADREEERDRERDRWRDRDEERGR